MNRRNALIGSFSIGIAAIMWGLDGVALTPQLYNLNVSFVVFVLHIIPFLLMNLFLFRQFKNLSVFSLKDFSILFAIALTGGSLGTLAIVKALFLVNFQDLSVVVLLQKLQPVFAVILAAVFLKERMSKYFALWASLAIFAGYTLTFGFHLPDFQTGSQTAYAAGFALLAAISFGSSTVFSKMMLIKYNFKTVTYFRYGFTSLIMFIWVISRGLIPTFGQITPTNWLFFIIIALTTGSGAIFLYYYGLTRVTALVSIIVELLFPISAIGFDYLINGTQLSLMQWISAVIMVLSIILLNQYSIKKPD